MLIGHSKRLIIQQTSLLKVSAKGTPRMSAYTSSSRSNEDLLSTTNCFMFRSNKCGLTCRLLSLGSIAALHTASLRKTSDKYLMRFAFIQFCLPKMADTIIIGCRYFSFVNNLKKKKTQRELGLKGE